MEINMQEYSDVDFEDDCPLLLSEADIREINILNEKYASLARNYFDTLKKQ